MGKELQISLKDVADVQGNESLRGKIIDFEEVLSRQEGAVFGDSELCPLKHSFTDGIYVREIFIPAGTVLTGKIHLHAHPNFLMSGEVEVVTEYEGLQHLKGPLAMISKPGTKRALKAITDVVWITIHHNPTNTQDLAELEKIVIAPSYEEYEKFVRLQENTGFIKRIYNLIKLKLS